MRSRECSGLKKLFKIVHFITLKGHILTEFKDHIKLEKSYKVKFNTSTYKNEIAYGNYMNGIASYFFEEGLRKKLIRVNFIAILIDGTN